MSIDTSKPVRLKRAPEMVGKISSVGPDNVVVTFEGGGTGRFPVEDLEQADAATAPADKSWPPRDLEVK